MVDIIDINRNWTPPDEATGWYGIPGGGRFTKIHVVSRDKKGPICGARIGPKMEFQWCAWHAMWGFIECEHCKRIILQRAREELMRKEKTVTRSRTCSII